MEIEIETEAKVAPGKRYTDGKLNDAHHDFTLSPHNTTLYTALHTAVVNNETTPASPSLFHRPLFDPWVAEG